jgi:exodeoxyribonuclease VII large subunit
MKTSLFDQPFEEDDGKHTEQEAGGPQPPVHRASPAVRTVLTVTDLTVRLRDLLEEQFYEVWVEGELSNCKIWNTGHLYFTLKDASCQLRGFMFRSSLRYLKFKPADGVRVIARGKISVYEPKGEYQLVCEHLEPHGLGALQLAFEQLKKRLQEEGLFDQARKRALPALPRRIGIVTSLEGAAIRDILKVLRRRYADARVVIRPARVQGDGAALEIARGLRAIARVPDVDVVIVGRGGGSIEDLWAFNEEVVARAIAACPVPVISAVGHEIDVTIADFVADVRAPTPSAAAEIVISTKDAFGARIDRLTHALTRVMRAELVSRDRRVQQLARRLASCDLGRRLEGIRTRLVAAAGRLRGAMAARRHRADRRLRECASRLDALSPLAVLGRGYAVCWNADRTTVIRDAAATSTGDRVRVTLARGELDCEVRDKSATTEATDTNGEHR